MAMMLDAQAVDLLTGVEFCFQAWRVLEVGGYHHDAAADFLWSSIPDIELVKPGVSNNEWFRVGVPG